MTPWPTPSPIPTANATAVLGPVMSEAGVTLAESLVQGYQQANNTGIIELVMMGFIAFIIIAGIYTIIRHVQSL